MPETPFGTTTAPLAGQELIDQPLYDTSEFNNATLLIEFFARPIGDAHTISALRKTLNDTNMRDSGKLSRGQSFKCLSIGLYLPRPYGDTDLPELIAKVFEKSVLVIVKNAKTILEAPGVMLTPGFGLTEYQENGLASVNYVQNGSPDSRSFWTFATPILFAEQEGFSCQLILPAATAVTGTRQLCCVMRGLLARPAV